MHKERSWYELVLTTIRENGQQASGVGRPSVENGWIGGLVDGLVDGWLVGWMID